MAIVVQDLDYEHPGGGLLFSGVSFRIGDREHASLVGVNGVGKSTLLRLLARELQPSNGAIQIDGRLQYMPQQVHRGDADATVRELLAYVSPEPLRTHALELIDAERALMSDASDDAGVRYADAIAHWGEAGGYTLEGLWDRCTASVLGQTLDQAADRPVRQLSGGEQKRLALEMLLTSDCENLLLDEPDNFLDIVGKRWLERQLNALNKTVLLVSHDRELLVRATRKVVTLEGHGAWVHGESFGTYYEAREARQERLEEALQRWNDEERRLFQYFRTMKIRAASSDANASRADAAETRWRKFVEAGPPTPPVRNQRIRMRLRGSDSGRKVLECTGLEIDGLIHPFDLLIRQGERVAVLGPNGTGKSHFLRLAAGEPVRHSGMLQYGARIKVGYFSQLHEHPEWRGLTVLEILQRADISLSSSMAILARYELQPCAQQRFETLSGGQQARLQVLLLERAGANLLLLDEPTDNLDLDSSEALEHALDEFTGTVVGVTHDRWLMRSFDRFLLFDDAGEVSEAPDLDAMLPVLAGEVAVAESGRRLKRLTLAPPKAQVAATPARREKQRNRQP
ncbi:MAG: ABC-F family ATP-binding cassette domain-containing protein [Chloroflexi bacterium]|nr:ABC-F family ATP-binding cassette domain-containing protein [Chloroflexota bacterium]